AVVVIGDPVPQQRAAVVIGHPVPQERAEVVIGDPVPQRRAETVAIGAHLKSAKRSKYQRIAANGNDLADVRIQIEGTFRNPIA
ncbi:unnamed protein product, partial [Aphanomyces euteiches]